MAIYIDNYHLENGLVANTSYHKVEWINGNKERITFDVKVYLTRDAMLEGSPILEQKTYYFVPDISLAARNFIYQCYEYLKTQPGYESGTDILE